MKKTDVIRKLVRGLVLSGIVLFFMTPYLMTLRSGVTGATNHADTAWSQQPVKYTSANLGINLPWLDKHDGNQTVNWLNTEYDGQKIGNDLTEIAAMGVKRVRTFCQMESMFNFKDGAFTINEQYAANLDDYLSRAEAQGISVICVMGDHNYSGQPQDLGGHLHLDMIKTPEGLQAYRQAYTDYVNHFKAHKNILMWETVNEPYGAMTWSPAAKEQGITHDHMHAFLKQSYDTIKPLAGDTYVGFSDIEEEEQPRYRIYSDEAFRTRYVDDSTDVYGMHIYRAVPTQVADFRGLTGKPKWALEFGAYNYDDPDALEHPLPATNQLYDTDENFKAVVPIAQKLINSGFTLVMPWSFTSNRGMVSHNPDGTHSLNKLPKYMKEQLLGGVTGGL